MKTYFKGNIMNRLYIIAFIFVLLVSCSNKKINWESDFEKALEISKQENKPIMMDVYTDWCGACKEMDKTTFANKDVIDNSSNFIALKFNPEKVSNGNDFLNKYSIIGFPTMLFMNGDGFVIRRIVGYVESDELINEMNGIKEKEENIKKVFADETPSIEKLDIYLDSGYTKEASEMYDVLASENKIPEENKAKYMSKIALMLLDIDNNDKAMEYFNEMIDKYSNYNEVYIAYYYKGLDMIINNGQTNEGIRYMENLANTVPDDMKEGYTCFLDYFSSTN